MKYPVLWVAATGAIAAYAALPEAPSSMQERAARFTPSLDISSCPGYKLGSITQNQFGLTASLSLAGAACNAFGHDITNLTIQVTYETNTRLHVQIVDTASQQYTIPDSVIARPPAPTQSFVKSSDLVFNYDSSPFAFWITRRSHPNAAPLFDTRISSLPSTPISAVMPGDNSTALDGFPLVFEDQYLQIASALPLDANIYGLGEVVASSGFRRNVSATIQPLWARDIPDPLDTNLYGSHPIYLEHRYDASTQMSQSHGVFLMSSAAGDIMLLTPPNAKTSLIEYRMIGGVLDFYFLSGPTPNAVIEQYGAVVGLPTWQPAWGFGFHLCRWGYRNITDTKAQVAAMREANIPLEVMWNDIDLYHATRDFTTDPVSFPADEMKAFIEQLRSNNQHYIPIIDAGIATQVNATDIYNPYLKGVEQDVFVKNPDGSLYIGEVWPGSTAFPDWFQSTTQAWWTEAFRNWSASGLEFSGIWLDMNELSSFCDGSCGTVFSDSAMHHRGLGAGHESGVNLTSPPYAIHNGNGALTSRTLSPDAVHAGGVVDLDVHNMWGMMEEKATHLALQSVIPNQRPFMISRSTFPSSGRWTGHWLGDNFSMWSYLQYSIQGVLQFQIFQIPFVGADTCGYNGDTTEELCNRWMQLAAFTPFYRNHNIQDALAQEPYRWESVANASRTAIAVRYSLLPYWMTLFANASTLGTPPVRALFYEFPNEPELFDVSSQFLLGSDILVTPVLDPNVTTVSGIFPGRGSVTWRDWYTHDAVKAASGTATTLAAPLGHINVHIRDGAAMLLHASPAYTIEETRQGPYSLLVSLSSSGHAHGTSYVDDGISDPPGPSRTLTFSAVTGQVSISGKGGFDIKSRLEEMTVLGVVNKPRTVVVNGQEAKNWTYAAAQESLFVGVMGADLNKDIVVQWK